MLLRPLPAVWERLDHRDRLPGGGKLTSTVMRIDPDPRVRRRRREPALRPAAALR
jgi:hypothetical protein